MTKEWTVITNGMQIVVEGDSLEEALGQWASRQNKTTLAKSVRISASLVRVKHKNVWRFWSNKDFLKAVGLL